MKGVCAEIVKLNKKNRIKSLTVVFITECFWFCISPESACRMVVATFILTRGTFTVHKDNKGEQLLKIKVILCLMLFISRPDKRIDRDTVFIAQPEEFGD